MNIIQIFFESLLFEIIFSFFFLVNSWEIAVFSYLPFFLLCFLRYERTAQG